MHRLLLSFTLVLQAACGPSQTVTTADLEALKARVATLEDTPPANLEGYARLEDLPDLTPYAKKADLTDYANKSDLTDIRGEVDDLESLQSRFVVNTPVKTQFSASNAWLTVAKANASVTLTAGTWDVTGGCNFSDSGGGEMYRLTLQWLSSGGPSPATLEEGGVDVAGGMEYMVYEVPSAAQFDAAVPASTVRLNITSTKDIYLLPKAAFDGSAGATAAEIYIYAKMVAP
jgi:hypothetical protein